MSQGKRGRPKAKTTRVTMAIPNDLLGFADLEGEALGVDRYDVMRAAMATGLSVMRAQRVMLEDPTRYAESIKGMFSGRAGAQEELSEQLRQGQIESLQRQVDELTKEAA